MEVNAGLNQLPTEMQMEVLKWLPTSDLLRNARLVTKLWNEIATPLCRRRGVKCRVHYFYKDPKVWFQNNPFKGADNLPWSTMTLQLCRPHTGTSLKVAKLFGTKLINININLSVCMYNNLVKVLGETPNVQSLSITADTAASQNTQFTVPDKGKVRLPKLKKLVISFYSNEFSTELLEFIITRTEAPLITIDLLGIACATPVHAMTYITKSNIKLRSLQLNYYGTIPDWEALANLPNIQVQKLRLQTRNFTAGEHYFRILERFLGNCVGLKSLTLENFDGESEAAPAPAPLQERFTVPPIPTLQYLHIIFNNRSLKLKDKSMYPHFVPFESGQFPRLEKVRVKFSDFCNVESVNVTQIFAGTFDTVKYLEAQNCDVAVHGNWTAVFPNVAYLSAIVKTPEALTGILQNAANLKSIYVTLRTYWTLDSFLSETFKSISSFNVGTLEELHMKRYYQSIGFTSTGAILFNLLPPIILTFSNVELEEDCVTELEEYHKQLKLKKSDILICID